MNKWLFLLSACCILGPGCPPAGPVAARWRTAVALTAATQVSHFSALPASPLSTPRFDPERCHTSVDVADGRASLRRPLRLRPHHRLTCVMSADLFPLPPLLLSNVNGIGFPPITWHSTLPTALGGVCH